MTILRCRGEVKVRFTRGSFADRADRRCDHYRSAYANTRPWSFLPRTYRSLQKRTALWKQLRSESDLMILKRSQGSLHARLSLVDQLFADVVAVIDSHMRIRETSIISSSYISFYAKRHLGSIPFWKRYIVWYRSEVKIRSAWELFADGTADVVIVTDSHIHVRNLDCFSLMYPCLRRKKSRYRIKG